MGRSRIAGAMMALAACSGGAGATALDKSACNELNAELAGLVAAGARDDMGRGPEWAKANLPPEKLERISRLIGLEEQLEFRCGIGHSRVVTIEPPKVPAGKVPDAPAKKPAARIDAAKPPQALNTQAVKSAAPPKAASAPARPAAAAAVRTPSVAAVTALKPPAAAAATPAVVPVPPAKLARAPVGGSLQTATTEPPPVAAPAKSSRRQASGYISPAEVNPYFVTRYGDAD